MLFVTEKYRDGRWRLSGWFEADSLEDALRRENESYFATGYNRTTGDRLIPEPCRMRAATAIEVAYATERNEFLSEQYGSAF